MKSLINKFIIISLLSIISNADISEDKLHDYLKVSSGGAMFLSYHSDTLIKFARKGYDKKTLKGMLDDDKYLNLFASEVVLLNDFHYDNIIEFYSTDVGKKYTKSMYVMAKINQNKIKELFSQYKCSNDKQKFISKIGDALNLIELRMSSIKESLHELNSLQPNNLKKSIYGMEILESTHESKLVKHEKIMSCIRYKDFTLKELKELYIYASSESGKYEAELMYRGFGRYLKVFMSDLKKLPRWECKVKGDSFHLYVRAEKKAKKS